MADEESSGRRSMDLNLYIGPPRSSPCRTTLGSAIAADDIMDLDLDVAPPAVYDARFISQRFQSLIDADYPSPPLPTVEENDELHIAEYQLDTPGRFSPPNVYPYPPPSPLFLDEVDFGAYRLFQERDLERSPPEDVTSPRVQASPDELRFRQGLGVNHRLRHRRSSVSAGRSHNRHRRPSSPTSEQLARDIMTSQRELEHGKNGTVTKRVAGEDSDDEMDEKIKNAANFECNICLDMAKGPVVTSCGHLFCWSCLYQWLHLHSDHKECPVCKGEVTESNITPIYGRGSSETDAEKKHGGKEEELYIEIPPRPRGNRLESVRQQFRPMSRRWSEGILNSWQRLVTERIHSRTNADPTTEGTYDAEDHIPIARTRARHRAEAIPESVRAFRTRDISPISQFVEHLNSVHGIPSPESVADMAADLRLMARRFLGSNSQYEATTSSVNPPAPELLVGRAYVPASMAADQISASSTMAVIQGDIPLPDASAEPNSAGSSRSHRRRGRNSAFDSSDVDGGAIHAHNRRRLH